MRSTSVGPPAKAKLDPANPSETAPKIGIVPLWAGRDSPFGSQAEGRIRKVKRKDNDGHCPA